MTKKTVEATLQLPEIPGYEYTGEYRRALSGEPALIYGHIHLGPSSAHYPILRKVDSWRPATVEDVVRAIRASLQILRSKGIIR